MITRDKASGLLGFDVRGAQGDDLGTVDAVYVDEQTDNPEFAAVRLSDSGQCLVPLASAEAQGGVLQLAYDRDQLQDVPVAGASDRLSQEEVAELYYHYGLDYTVTVTEQHTVHLDRSDSDDTVGAVEERHDVQVQRDPTEVSPQTDQTRMRPPRDSEDLGNRTVVELRQLAAERGIAGCSQ